MTRDTALHVFACLFMASALCFHTARSTGATPPERPAADLAEMQKLEARLFKPSLSSAEADRLIEALKAEATRETAAEKLVNGAAGYQQRLAAFAHGQSDIDAREAAVDVVGALDTAYRTTDAGKKLCALYARHADQLVPQAWRDFRKDPLDLRAAAVLVSADPDKVQAWLDVNGERRDALRFVLLRIREIPKDERAAKRLASYSYRSFELAARDVFPAGNVRRG